MTNTENKLTENGLFHQMMEELHPYDGGPVSDEFQTLALTDGSLTGTVQDKQLFDRNAGDVETTELKQLAEGLKSEDSLSIDFWLKFPIRVRPLRFVPGRNRAEKRSYRKLADQAERGTITKGNLKKLRGFAAALQRLGLIADGTRRA